MVYKKFYINIIVRVIMIAINCLVLFYYWWNPEMIHLKFALAGMFILQVFLLIWFLNRINRRLSMFFDAVKSDDFNVIYSDYSKRGEFTELNNQLDKLSRYFKKLKLENEQHDLYFKAVIEHVGTGIFAFNEIGRIRFINTATLEMLGISYLKNIQGFDNIEQGLTSTITNLKPGRQQLLEIPSGGEVLQLTARLTLYQFEEEQLNLVSLQNIRSELEQQETQTWQKMIRVLTHEIVNSISPITSLAASLSRIVDTAVVNNNETSSSDRKLIKGLGTIKSRGEGLVDFVEKYRKLTILPDPQIAVIPVNDLFNGVKTLFDEQIRKEKMQFQIIIEPGDLILHADREQIEQVLINLVKNAIWAVQENDNKIIELHAGELPDGNVIFHIIDNGFGVETELRDKIFIPFFTTRENGSGIGLSLSRQIMIMHGGSISVQSKPSVGTTFVLRFKA
ncbi:MAG: PAS domain-containing protein [Bacteroidales bacterium]|nr:PAS domain-containing protein [Bacteroidales bacterium]